jgi:hypothetical protein
MPHRRRHRGFREGAAPRLIPAGISITGGYLDDRSVSDYCPVVRLLAGCRILAGIRQTRGVFGILAGFPIEVGGTSTYVALQQGRKRSQPTDERNADMRESDFWNNYAEAMELSVEGNRLIAREIAGLFRGLWQRAARALDGATHGIGQHRHLPPV